MSDDFFYVLFFYTSLLAALVDKFYVVDRYKGKYGAFIGFLSLLYLSGLEIIYPLVNIAVNALIICFFRKRCGILTFIFTCGYLFFFRYFCSVSSITNVFMMSTTLRMISVAVDFSSEEKRSKELVYRNSKLRSFKHITCYALHYIGLIGVPFYTFDTYWDYIIMPFKHHQTEWQYQTIICLVDSVIFMFGRYLLNSLWPMSYVMNDQFYSRSIFYRIWYIYPISIDFILRIGHAFIITNASCFVSGLGAYPDFTKAKCGHGPTSNLEKMSMITRDNLYKYDFTYTTVSNVNMTGVHFSVEFKESIKYWNMTIQFWLYKYVYNIVPFRFLKKPATLLFSSYWHGLNSGNFISIFFSSLILFLEKRFDRILVKSNISSLEKILRTILKTHILYSLCANFVFQKWYLIVRYQTSVYWNYVVILFILFIFSFCVEKKYHSKL